MLDGTDKLELQDKVNKSPESRNFLEPYFDVAFYCDRYRDINVNAVDPLEHYMIFGWEEGRDPCSWFSTRRYIAHNPDVAENGLNPFLHYVTIGKSQGRKIWPADYIGPYELSIDPVATFTLDYSLRNLIAVAPGNYERALPPLLLTHLIIHWVIPDFKIGSGGHMTIFRLIRWLEFVGHKCTVWIINPEHHTSAEAAYEDVLKHFQTIQASIAFAENGFIDAQGDAVIATGWQTVPNVVNTSGFRERFYLVQDHEPSFHAVGSHALVAEWTYTQDLGCICASPWLDKIMREKYGRWTSQFYLAYDKTIYYSKNQPVDTSNIGKSNTSAALPRIAVYARLSSPRRAVELTLLALEVLAAKDIAFHVDLFGEDLKMTRAPFSCSIHGILDAEHLAELYRNSDIGVCFSATNYSLIPQEMMACGLAVVELNGESTQAVFPKDVITLTGPHPYSIASDLAKLLGDPNRRKRQAAAALQWVSQFDWERSARSVEGALLERLRPHCKEPDVVRSARRSKRTAAQARLPADLDAACKASVCIPTYNGGELLTKVVERVQAQRVPWPYEIVIVDSGSSDGSIEKLSISKTRAKSLALPSLRIRQIPKTEFQHGRTRNLCAATARGEFVAFLTQDALPTDEFWLYNLVTVLARFPNAAGAFGRHIPWPTSTVFTQRDISSHFDNLLGYPLVLCKQSQIQNLTHDANALRQFLHYFSDNNSCLRRSVWEKIPYPEIDYGEDQVWADSIIQRGYEKLYVPTAPVYHSHNYTLSETSERSETEAYFFAVKFGYRLYDFTKTFQSQLAYIDAADTRWARENQVSEQDLAQQLAVNKAKLYGQAKGMEKAYKKISQIKL